METMNKQQPIAHRITGYNVVVQLCVRTKIAITKNLPVHSVPSWSDPWHLQTTCREFFWRRLNKDWRQALCMRNRFLNVFLSKWKYKCQSTRQMSQNSICRMFFQITRQHTAFSHASKVISWLSPVVPIFSFKTPKYATQNTQLPFRLTGCVSS